MNHTLPGIAAPVHVVVLVLTSLLFDESCSLFLVEVAVAVDPDGVRKAGLCGCWVKKGRNSVAVNKE